MKYTLETTKAFDKEFKKLDNYTKQIIKSWIVKNIANIDNPRDKGKALTGNYKGLWRYRVGDYRIICAIEDDKLVILALSVGHRSSVYKK